MLQCLGGKPNLSTMVQEVTPPFKEQSLFRLLNPSALYWQSCFSVLQNLFKQSGEGNIFA